MEVAVVLGTSKYKTGGGNNLFFDNRIKAAAELYKSKKVSKIVVSGTNEQYYDEPGDMKESLLAYGVPESDIILDNEGFRTLHSVENSLDKYSSIVLVTQRFHAYRGLFICNTFGLKAVCLAAEFPSEDYSYLTIVREVFARPKAIIDLYL